MSLYFILLVLKQLNVPYAKICVPNVVKNWNVKLFNVMSRTNEIRHIKCHETCVSVNVD